MDLFGFIGMLFTDPEGYASVSKGEKKKHFFMCGRRFSIAFPMEANVLQHLKINQVAAVDYWQWFFRKKYGLRPGDSLPGWTYTKGAKKAQEAKDKKLTVDGGTISEYCRRFGVDPKSVEDALEFFPEQMTKEIKEFENMLKQR